MPVTMAQASKAKPTKKTLARLVIEPQLGGGHVITHEYHGFGHEPKAHKFNSDGKSQGGEHILSHISKHAGLPGREPYDERMESETEDEINT